MLNSELWLILPHARQAYTRRCKLQLGVPMCFGRIVLTLLADRQEGEQRGLVQMRWCHLDEQSERTTALIPVYLGRFGEWVPVAVSSSGAVLFNVDAPAMPMTVAA